MSKAKSESERLATALDAGIEPKKRRGPYKMKESFRDPVPDSEGRTYRYELKTFGVEFVRGTAEPPLGRNLRSAEEVWSTARAIYLRLDADKEHFAVLALNNKNRLIGYKVISTGSLTASLVHPRDVYRSALHFCAAGVVFVHNHPSGDPEPSAEDIDLTKRLKEVGDVMGIRVLDHVVLGDEKYFSFNDRGMV
jgi:DNA repair protein RadC